jgi:beta-fructofuranosidase
MKKRVHGATRREFLATAGATAAATLMPRGVMAQGVMAQGISADEAALETRLAADPMRPQFHLLPAKNWMNDPNGPIYFNGSYHMFFQYNPHGPTWGDMNWNHAVSKDMMHWTHLPIALTPTPGSADAFGCFSGSAIPLGKRIYMIYTGTVQSTPELATLRDGHSNILETQCLAYSNDPKLIHWSKLPQPVIATPPPGMKVTGFRDPSVWKQDDWYYMIVGSGEVRVGGCVLLYRSKDLKAWEYLHQLTSGRWTGKPAVNPCDSGEMWECPEFFELDGGYVLIYSTTGKVFWESGKLDEETMKFKPMKTGLLDLDAFYAPKTQLDAQGRRILWGWIPERRSDDEMRKAGWSGMMSLPRVMNLDQGGSLRLTMLPELKTLRGLPTKEVPKACGEVLYAGKVGEGDFKLVLRSSDDGKELLHAVYSAAAHTVTVDGHEIPVAPGEGAHLHGYIDGSVIDLIVNKSVGYTKRFYYQQTTAPNIKVDGVDPTDKVEAASIWGITPISDNRLTTPARS